MRRHRFAVALVVGWVFLSGSGKTDANKCETAVRGKLLNPETAQFYDFIRLSKSAYHDLIFEDARQSFDPKGKYPSETADEWMENLEASTRFYRIRVRAEGQLGNKVTTFYQCEIDNKSCYCWTSR